MPQVRILSLRPSLYQCIDTTETHWYQWVSCFFISDASCNTLIIKSSGSIVPGPSSGGSVPLNNNAHRIGVIKYNLTTNVGTIDNADTTTPCIGNC